MAVEAGAGATAFPGAGRRPRHRPRQAESDPAQLPERAFTVLRHRERYLSKAARAFLDEIKGKSAN